MVKTYNTSRRQGQPLQFRAKDPKISNVTHAIAWRQKS